MKPITLTIDGKQVSVLAGKTVLEAAQAAGADVPTLCHHPALPPEGACRLCLVEVEGQRALQPACTFPATDGMVVHTSTPQVEDARRFSLNLLLSDHPLDCMICDAAGDCELQNLAYRYHMQGTTFPGREHDYAIDSSNPFIQIDRNKCILCRRCVRACNVINGVEAISVVYRGFDAHIAFGADGGMQDSPCEFCGSCVSVCPTAALLPKEAIGKGRPWEFEKTTTTCSYCGVGCQFDLNVKNGRLIKVTPHWDAPANQGWTCVKGQFGFDYVNHVDRLTTPLIRRSGHLEPATWDEALDFVANRLNAIRSESGPDSVAVLASAKATNEENYLLQKFTRQLIGTNNVDHCARLCHSASVAGLATSLGSGAMTNTIDDIATQANAYFVIGSNTTEQHPIIGMKLRQAVKQRGAQLIVADPRDIPLAAFATLHLRHRPGTDIALLNGIMHVLITENLYDTAFVEQRTENFEELCDTVMKYTPQVASEITRVPADDIVRAARILATNKPGALLYAMGITQHRTGTHNVMSCANLQLLLGNLGIPGGGINPLRGQNNVQGACDMGALPNVYPGYQNVAVDDVRRKFEDAWGASLSPKPGLTVMEMMNAAEHGNVRAMLVMGENPMLTDPDVNHVRQCLMSLELLVVQDIFLSETAALADVVLPAASFAEKDGTFTNTERRVQLIRRAISPPGQALADWEIVMALAQRLLILRGSRDEMPLPSTYAGWDYLCPADIMDEIAALTPSYGGIHHWRLEKHGLQWPCPNDNHPGTPILHVGKFTRGLGRFTAVEHVPPAELPDAEFPLTLTTGRVLYHYHSGNMTRRSKGLDAQVPEGLVDINPQDAREMGVTNGAWVDVLSRRGEVTTKARVTQDVPPGVVFMTFHFAEAPANALTNAALDPIAKIPEFKACAVAVRPAANGAH